MTSLNYGDLDAVAAASGCTPSQLDAWIRKHLADAPSPHDNPDRARRIIRIIASTEGGDRDDA